MNESRFAHLFYTHKKKLFFLTLIIFFAGIPLLKNLESDFSFRIWFKEGDRNLKIYDDFQKDFGNDDSLAIAINTPQVVFTNQTLSDISEISEKLIYVQNVMRVESLTASNVIQSSDDEVISAPLIPERNLKKSPLTKSELSSIESNAKSKKEFKNFILGKDDNVTAVFLSLKPGHGTKSPNYIPMFKQINKILESYKKRGYDFHISGTSAYSSTVKKLVGGDMKIILPTLMVALIIIMMMLFRNIVLALFPIGLVILTIVSSLEICALIGIKYNPITALLPSILLAICLADSIHLIGSYLRQKQTHDHEKALQEAIKKNFFPTFLTSLTTAVGLFGLSVTDIGPVEGLGFMAGIGTILAWLYTFTLLPFTISLGGKNSRLGKSIDWTKLMSSLESLSLKNSRIIIFLSLLIFVWGASLISNVRIDSNLLHMLPKDHALTTAVDYTEKKLGGTRGLDVIFTAPDGENLYSENMIQQVTKLEDWLNETPYVTKVQSYLNVLRATNRVLHNDSPEFEIIPNDRQSRAQTYLVYELARPSQDGSDSWLTIDKKRARMKIYWTLKGSLLHQQGIDTVQNKINELQLNAHLAGKTALLTGLDRYLVDTFFESMIFVLLIITIIMMIIFRNIKLGLISLIPNLAPLATNALIMWAFDISLNSGTVLVVSVSLGIAVDDTIHFLTHYQNLKKSGSTTKDAIREVMQITGPALIMTTGLLVIAFSTFILGTFKVNQYFGLLTSAALFVALFADLFILAPLLLLLDKVKAKPILEEALS